MSLYTKAYQGQIALLLGLLLTCLSLGSYAQGSKSVVDIILSQQFGSQLSTPIYDPFEGGLVVLRIDSQGDVFAAYPDSIPAAYCQISANFAHEWYDADSLWRFSDDRFYCRISDKIFLSDEHNTLHVALRVPQGDDDATHYYHRVDIDIHYTKPMIELLDINDSPYDGAILFVSDPSEAIEATLRAFRHFDGNHPLSNIASIKGRHASQTELITLYEAVGDDGEPEMVYTVDALLQALQTTLDAGLNTFEFRARGVCNECLSPEYSDPVFFSVFYLDLEYGEAQESMYLHDVHYALQGIPEGGSFSGPGIIDHTRFFNPAVAGSGTHEVQYTHPYGENGTFQASLTIEVLEGVPDVPIGGPQEVCRGAMAHYTFDDVEGGEEVDQGELEVDGGEVKVFNGDGFWIEWHGEGAGFNEYTGQKGSIRLRGHELVVDISKDELPDSPEIELINNNLLVCSDAGAAYYRWFHNDEQLHDAETTQPYFYLDNINLQAGDKLHVEIGNRLGAFECFAASEPLHVSHNQTAAELAPSITLYPNPCHDQLSILLNDVQGEVYRVDLIDNLGRVRYTENLPDEAGGHIILNLNCLSFKAGLYFIRIWGQNEHHVEKLFIDHK